MNGGVKGYGFSKGKSQERLILMIRGQNYVKGCCKEW